MTREEIENFKVRLHKNYIRMMTSSQYQSPPNSKDQAFVKWLDVSIAFDGVVRDLKLNEEK
jgi:hypothetical protein